jgi:hypothetical protein
MRFRRVGFAIAVVGIGLVTNGCAAMHMQMRHGTLASEAKVSESIFLELSTDLPPTIHVSETSGVEREVVIGPGLEQALTASGYRVVDDPRSATYVLQVHHRQLIEADLTDVTLRDALGSALTAGYVAGVAADLLGGDYDAVAGIALVVGFVSFVADASVRHVGHVLTTDVRLTETVPGRFDPATPMAQERRTSQRHHDIQVASGASRVNLRFEESLPAIQATLAQTLARLLPEQPVPAEK